MSRPDANTHAMRPDADQAQRWVRLIVNPISGVEAGTLALPLIVTALEAAGMQVVISFVGNGKPPDTIAADAVRAGYDLVVAVGGDGTVSSVARGMLQSTVPLGIIPLGTYNNIARSLGIPFDLDGALQNLIDGTPRMIDTALANGRMFMEVAGVGIDARLFPVAEEIKRGAWHQVATAVRSLRYFRPRKVRIELADGTRFIARPLMALVSNMPYFGVGFAIAPHARPDSGDLTLSLFQHFTKLELLQYFALIANGRAVHEPRIETYTSPRIKISVTTRPPVRVQADGLIVGKTPLVCEVVPQALKVLAPL
ncbi:MAG TPA: diacylglycerol kinase family lipid kinase [Roseiflexaceae bacterium]|nr:diacylglycerol kinase family lipid kinase [Roseiflexaceae bacterium]HMP42647.1 diacylglycerol kinase family lipid kinase [Roseiflexaceae bacterium]